MFRWKSCILISYNNIIKHIIRFLPHENKDKQIQAVNINYKLFKFPIWITLFCSDWEKKQIRYNVFIVIAQWCTKINIKNW